MVETMTTCIYHFMSVLDRIKHPSLAEHKKFGNIARADGHIISLIKDYIVEPVVISSHNARQSPIYDKTVTVLSDIFTSYYIQAFRILCDHYGLDVVSTVNVLTSDKGGEFKAFFKSGIQLAKSWGESSSESFNINTYNLNTTRYLSNNYYGSLMGDGKFLRVSSEKENKGGKADKDNKGDNNQNNNNDIPDETKAKINKINKNSKKDDIEKQADKNDKKDNKPNKNNNRNNNNNKGNNNNKNKGNNNNKSNNSKGSVDDEFSDVTKWSDANKKKKENIKELADELGGSSKFGDFLAHTLTDSEPNKSKYNIKGRTGKITSLADMEKNPLYKIHTRNIEIELNHNKGDKNKIIVPITIKTVVLSVGTEDIHNLIEHGNASKGFKDRLFDLINGNLKFRDFLFASDMIEQYKKNKIKDREGLVKLVRQRNTYRDLTDSTTAKGFDANYNLLLLTTEDVEKFEPILGGKITKDNVKEKLLNDTRSLAGVVLDDDYERATIITSKIRGFNNVGYGLLKSRDESKGYEDILKSLLNNKPMSF